LSILIEHVSKRFSVYPALDDVSLRIEEREFIALLGPSGSGKTTLLRMIAGLDFPDTGSIRFGEKDVTGTPAAKRGIGFVFQQYALFKHMTVERNVAFGLDILPRRRRPSREKIQARVAELLELVHLTGYEKRYPTQLSGGQQQRVALARALARDPSILLLDEPFGALDSRVRRQLRRSLREIHDQVGVTSIFVTHDHEEAFALADRVAILNEGRVEQFATPEETVAKPASEFVRSFLE
jgi:sulfate transport system ATP-binding protein